MGGCKKKRRFFCYRIRQPSSSGYLEKMLSMLERRTPYSRAVAMVILSKGSLWICDRATAREAMEGDRGNISMPAGSRASFSHRWVSHGRESFPFCRASAISKQETGETPTLYACSICFLWLTGIGSVSPLINQNQMWVSSMIISGIPSPLHL